VTNLHDHGYTQRGATLIVALVMLVLMTMLALGAISISTGNLKVVGNMQYQQEATSAAQSAINQILSKGTYLTDPTTAPTSITANVNGHDYPVTLTPPCLKSVTVLTIQELEDLPAADKKTCKSTDNVTNSGIFGQNPGAALSDCARVVWQVAAAVNDTTTNARVSLVEGAIIKMDRVVADAYKTDDTKRCP
jgi:Tfp pilus assembly protein PilX